MQKHESAICLLIIGICIHVKCRIWQKAAKLLKVQKASKGISFITDLIASVIYFQNTRSIIDNVVQYWSLTLGRDVKGGVFSAVSYSHKKYASHK